jgi:predicted kinase
MKTYTELQEGVYDPNIFKAFFLAGGPGSGKSYVARRTTGGTGLKTINSDDQFEHLLKKAGLSLKMPKSQETPRNKLRDRAKDLTVAKRGNYLDGRLGLIIDGTARDPNKILRQHIHLKELGYDTHMIFVNTSVDVALTRNAERARSVPEEIVVRSWKEVQGNMGKFSQIFRSNFIVVDNNDAGEDVFIKVFKQIQSRLRIKPTSGIAKNWIAMELAKKKR